MSGGDSSPRSKHLPGVAVTADWSRCELSPSYHSSLVFSRPHHQPRHCTASYLTLQSQPHQHQGRRRRKLSEPDCISGGTRTAFVDLRSRDLQSQTTDAAQSHDVRSYYSMTSCAGNADFEWTAA